MAGLLWVSYHARRTGEKIVNIWRLPKKQNFSLLDALLAPVYITPPQVRRLYFLSTAAALGSPL